MTNLQNPSELLPIHSDNGKATVSAKQLYIFLGYNVTHWSKWYKRNIQDNKFFTENEDWVPLALGANANGSPNMDFEITIDFAKDLSMQAKTEKGNQARKYFIECERKVLNPSDDDILNKAFQIMNVRLLGAEKIIEEQKAQLAIQAPIVENHKAFLSYAGLTTLADAAGTLGTKQYKLTNKLVESKIFTPKNRKPTQDAISKGWFVLRPVEIPDGSIYYQPMVTSAGMDALTSLYKTHNDGTPIEGLGI